MTNVKYAAVRLRFASPHAGKTHPTPAPAAIIVCERK